MQTSGYSSLFAAALGVGGVLLAATLIEITPGSRSQAENFVHHESEFADESRCIDCHEQAEDFHETGHSNTLQPAGSEYSLRLLQEWCDQNPELKAAVREDGSKAVLSIVDGKLERETTIDFCLGSGTHAHTWVSMLQDSTMRSDLMELRWSWFSSLNGWDLTPGQLKERGNGAVTSMGLLFDGPKANRCLSCHSTHIATEDGRIQTDRMVHGVGCQRCHGPRGQHVKSDGEIHPSGWQIKDRMDSVKRCAVCHRMPGERDPHEIRPGNVDIVRFQPMGLLQSACFVKSDMSCVTCHDPHRPMNAQDSAGIWQCIQCHDPNHSETKHASVVTCGAGETDRCLECHMPKVPHDFPVSFTDHWIRVPEAPAP